MAGGKYKTMIHHEMGEEKKGAWNHFMDSLREVVFGLEDGIVSTLGAITGIAAATRDFDIVVLSAFVIIFVESLSMAAGTYLSNKSESEVEERMLAEERYEIEHFPEKERKELEEFYTERGFSPDEVQILVSRVIQDPDLWLEEMAFKELGVIPGREMNPVRDALVMGVSYIIGGLVAVSMYFVFPVNTAIYVAVAFSVVVLFGIGFAKGQLVHTNRVKSGLEMMVVSLSAAAVGYIVGQIITSMTGISV